MQSFGGVQSNIDLLGSGGSVVADAGAVGHILQRIARCGSFKDIVAPGSMEMTKQVAVKWIFEESWKVVEPGVTLSHPDQHRKLWDWSRRHHSAFRNANSPLVKVPIRELEKRTFRFVG